MPVFHYQAIDKKGRSLRGTMPAHDESNLQKRLKDVGLWLTDAALQHSGSATTAASGAVVKLPRLRGKKLRRELIDFCTLMNYQSKVGVTLVRSLDVACKDCRSPAFRQVLTGLQAEIEAGHQFHEALAKYPAVFSYQFICVIKAGESTGKIAEAMEDLRKYLEWVDQMLADVRQSTLYPMIIAIVVCLFAIFLFTFIVPKFAVLLVSLHVPLPLITRIIFAVSDILCGWWYVWAPLLVVAAVAIPVGRRVSRPFALWLDALKLHLPIFGDLNRMLALSRFAHNLALLYRSGVVILSALNLTEGLVGNATVAQAIADVQNDIKAGKTVSEAMRRQTVFSALLVRMVTVGEQSGNFDQALDTVSEYYNDIIPRRIKALFTVMEPLLMLALIFVVGSVALAIYAPIIALMGGLEQH